MLARENLDPSDVMNQQYIHRMFKKAVGSHPPTPARQDVPFRGQGRNEQRGEAYFLSYGEPLRDVRTQLERLFNILLGRNVWAR